MPHMAVPALPDELLGRTTVRIGQTLSATLNGQLTRYLNAQSSFFQVATSAPVSLQKVVSERLPFMPFPATECVGFLDTPIGFAEACSAVLGGGGLQLCKAIGKTSRLAALSVSTTGTPVPKKDLCTRGMPRVILGTAERIVGAQVCVGLGQACATVLSRCRA